MNEFMWSVRVYYEDTDAGGVVYHSQYLNFMERARTEWLRGLGYEQDRLIEETGILFAVRRIAVDFRRPARFNDVLEVSARVIAHGKASLTFLQEVRRRDGELLCSGEIKIACLDAAAFRPRQIPEPLLTEMLNVV